MDEPQFVEPVFEPTEAHPIDENPEDHIGVEVPDPWTDPNADEAWRPKPGVNVVQDEAASE